MASQHYAPSRAGLLLEVDDRYLPLTEREKFWSHRTSVSFNGMVHQASLADLLQYSSFRDSVIRPRYLEFCNKVAIRPHLPPLQGAASTSFHGRTPQAFSNAFESTELSNVCQVCGVGLAAFDDTYCQSCHQYFTQQISTFTNQLHCAQQPSTFEVARRSFQSAVLPTPPLTNSPSLSTGTPNTAYMSVWNDALEAQPDQRHLMGTPVLAPTQLPVTYPRRSQTNVQSPMINPTQISQETPNRSPTFATPIGDQSSHVLPAAIPTSSPSPPVAEPAKRGGRRAWDRATCESCGSDYPYNRITEVKSCRKCIRKVEKKTASAASAAASLTTAYDDGETNTASCNPIDSQDAESEDEVVLLSVSPALARKQRKADREARRERILENTPLQTGPAASLLSQPESKRFEGPTSEANAESELERSEHGREASASQHSISLIQQPAPVAPMLSEQAPYRFTSEDLETIAPHAIYDPERNIAFDEWIQSIEEEFDPVAEAESTMAFDERVYYGYKAHWELF